MLENEIDVNPNSYEPNHMSHYIIGSSSPEHTISSKFILHDQLKSDLDALNVQYTEVQSNFPDEENLSLLMVHLHDIDQATLLSPIFDLARKYKQSTVIEIDSNLDAFLNELAPYSRNVLKEHVGKYVELDDVTHVPFFYAQNGGPYFTIAVGEESD